MCLILSLLKLTSIKTVAFFVNLVNYLRPILFDFGVYVVYTSTVPGMLILLRFGRSLERF